MGIYNLMKGFLYIGVMLIVLVINHVTVSRKIHLVNMYKFKVDNETITGIIDKNKKVIFQVKLGT